MSGHHEIHVCRDCGAELTLPYGGLADTSKIEQAINRFADATGQPRPYPEPDAVSETLADFDVDWFTAEVVAYFKVFDYHEVWKPSGARALGEWLVLHSSPHAVSDQPHDPAIRALERKRG